MQKTLNGLMGTNKTVEVKKTELLIGGGAMAGLAVGGFLYGYLVKPADVQEEETMDKLERAGNRALLGGFIGFILALLIILLPMLMKKKPASHKKVNATQAIADKADISGSASSGFRSSA